MAGHILNRFLRMAVVAGVESAVQVHIDRGDDLNARDEKGQTPLMLSAARNRASICRLLIAAGADCALLDPSGTDALGIARAAGASEAAAAITAFFSSKVGSDRNSESIVMTRGVSDSVETETAAPTLASRSAIAVSSGAENEALPDSSLADFDEDDSAFDLGGWEPEEEQLPPREDPTVQNGAARVQAAISEHRPIDTSSNWEDLEIYLPEQASPLPRVDDIEAREQLRLVLLRAIREGSVPESLVEDLSLDDFGTPDEEARSILCMVINDLGAETDERFEYSAHDENFVVSVDPEETSDEEGLVSSALIRIDDLASPRNEPLRIFQRQWQHEPVLNAEAEVALGQAMERGLGNALDALANWTDGVQALLDSARLVKSGKKPLRWLSSGPRHDAESSEIPADYDPDSETDRLVSDAGHVDRANSQSVDEEEMSNDVLSQFMAKTDLLSKLSENFSHDGVGVQLRRNAIAALNLTSSFLLDLAHSEIADHSEHVQQFRQAMKTFRSARDRMTTANIKLVLSIAKKYLYTGQPLDDLLQEGNIGLLKAVEKYDWRRGFKFSTYATWWIRQAVTRYLADKCRTIRLPVHLHLQVQQVSHAAHALELKSRRPPKVDEIAAAMDQSSRKIAQLMRLAQEPMPFDEYFTDDLIAIDAVDEFTIPDPMETVGARKLAESVVQSLTVLKPKEDRVLRLRFGIGVADSMTLEEIGLQLELTRERVRQIEAKAISKLTARMNSLTREVRSGAPMTSNSAEVSNEVSQKPEPDAVPRTHRSMLVARQSSKQDRVPKASVIDRLLEQAASIGVTVQDDREGNSKRVWIHVTETTDTRSRQLVRKLVTVGFEFWPGIGYWR